MKIKSKIQKLVSPLYNKVWHGPKGRLKSHIKEKCDALPQKKRMTLVFTLLGAFILTAFFLFGNACYKMGARQAVNQIEVQHIQSIPMPEPLNEAQLEIMGCSKLKAYEEVESEIDVEPIDTTAYEVAR